MTTPIWQPGTTLEGCNATSARTMVEGLGIVFTELGPDFIRGTMPVDARSVQPMGILHGGASVAFAETLASVGANCTVDRRTQAVVGQEINANHLRP
ncbi:MAG: hotdog fold thioesterase, partial [Gammaproteobacteria bacterium]